MFSLGLVFDESVARDKTLEEDTSSKPKIALQEDPRQSEVSDLHAWFISSFSFVISPSVDVRKIN